MSNLNTPPITTDLDLLIKYPNTQIPPHHFLPLNSQHLTLYSSHSNSPNPQKCLLLLLLWLQLMLWDWALQPSLIPQTNL